MFAKLECHGVAELGFPRTLAKATSLFGVSVEPEKSSRPLYYTVLMSSDVSREYSPKTGISREYSP
jgi:hypothetical protein